MDMKSYYRRIRELEAGIADKDAVIVSEQTNDGGRAGIVRQAPKAVVARLVAEGRARLASEVETNEYLASIKERYALAEQVRHREKHPLAVLTAEDGKASRPGSKPERTSK